MTIKAYDDTYDIHSDGKVYNKKLQRFLNPIKHTGGYFTVHIHQEKKYLHRLVAEAFIPNPDNKPTVNHISGIKIDNDISNLEWNTQSEQMYHSYSLGMRVSPKTMTGLFGKDNPTSKRIKQMDLNGNLIKIWDSQSDVMRQLNLKQSSISNCCRGRRKSYGGFKWSYFNP